MEDIKQEDIDLGIEKSATSKPYEEQERIEIQACRVCLLTECRLYSLTRLCMEEVYRTVTGLPLSHEDSLPRTLCAECVALLNKCYQFRQKSQRGYYCLLGILEKHRKVTLDMVKKVNRKKYKLKSNLVTIEIKSNLDCQFVDVSDEFLKENKIKKEPDLDDYASVNGSHVYTVNDNTDSNVCNFTSFKASKCAIDIPLNTVKKSKTQDIVDEDNTLDNEFNGFVYITEEFIGGVQNHNKEINANHKEEPKAKLKRRRKREYQRKTIDTSRRKQLNAEYQRVLKDNFVIKTLSLDEQKEEICKRKQSDNYLRSPFKCEYCFQGFKRDTTYKTHMFKHSEKSGSLSCDVCHKRCPSRTSMLKHLQLHWKLYSCSRCNFTTSSSGTARLHLDWHQGKSYKCDICEEVFLRASTLLSHLRIKHPSDNVCTFCGYSFIGQHGLKTHHRLKHSEENLEISSDSPRCDKCDIQFVSDDALQTHLQVSLRHTTVENLKRNDSQVAQTMSEGAAYFPRNVERAVSRKKTGRRKKEDVPRNRREGQIKVACKECGRNFSSLHSRRIHMGHMHRLSVPVKVRPGALCEECGQVFQCPSQLRDHAMVHSDIKSFTCTVCGKRFKKQSSLIQHKRLHVEKYPCPQCHKIFNHRANRDRHLTNVHSDIRDVKCSFCDKLFKSDEVLKAHTDHVHLKKPWPKRNRQRAREGQTTPRNNVKETNDESS